MDWIDEGTIPDKIRCIRSYKPHKPREAAMPAVPITEEQVNRINSQLRNGSKNREVAESVGVAVSTVSKYRQQLIENGLDLKRGKRTKPKPQSKPQPKPKPSTEKRIPLLLTPEEYNFIQEWRGAQ